MNQFTENNITMSISVGASKGVLVNTETGSVTLTGIDIDEVIQQIPVREVLMALDYSDILEYVAENEKDKADMLAEEQADRER